MGWLWWLGGALLLGVAEMFSLDLIFLMLAAGALGGALGDVLGLPLAGQIVLAAATSLLGLFALRPFLLRRLRARTMLVETNAAALVGRPAVVVAPTDAGGGRVKLAGEVWTARAADASGSFAPGDQVRVAAIEGATAVVEREVAEHPSPAGPAGAGGTSGTGPVPGAPAAS